MRLLVEYGIRKLVNLSRHHGLFSNGNAMNQFDSKDDASTRNLRLQSPNTYSVCSLPCVLGQVTYTKVSKHEWLKLST